MNQVEIKRRQIQLCAVGLWLVVIWILGKSLGDNGVAYLAAALEAFIFLWAIVGANVSDTLGKLLRGRNVRGQYKNADKLFKCTFVFQGIAGMIGSFLFFCLANYFSETLLQVPYSRFLIMILSPCVFLRCVNGVILGNFQGDGSELPTTVASILRPLFLLGFGLLFSRMLTDYGEKVSNLLGQDAFTSMYCGVGVVIAMVLTEVLVLVFLLLIYKGSSRSRRKKDSEGMRTTDSFAGQIYVLYGSMGLYILQGLLLFLPVILGLIFYRKNASDIDVAAQSYGLYIGKYLVVCGVMIALIASSGFPSAVKAGGLLRKEENRAARNIFQSGFKAVLVYSLFFAVLFTVMSSQLAETISESMVSLLAEMLAAGSGIVLFGTVAYYCYTVLKVAGKKHWVLGGLALANMVYAVSLSLWFGKNPGNIMALVYGSLVYTGVLAVLLTAMICVIIRGGMDPLRIFAIPVGCVCVAGLLGHILGKALTPHLGGTVTFVAVFVLSWMLYLMLVVFLRCFREQELSVIPGGRILKGLGQLLGVF